MLLQGTTDSCLPDLAKLLRPNFSPSESQLVHLKCRPSCFWGFARLDGQTQAGLKGKAGRGNSGELQACDLQELSTPAPAGAASWGHHSKRPETNKNKRGTQSVVVLSSYIYCCFCGREGLSEVFKYQGPKWWLLVSVSLGSGLLIALFDIGYVVVKCLP